MAPPPPKQSPETAAVSIGERAAVFGVCLPADKQISGPFGANYDAGETHRVHRWDDIDPNYFFRLRAGLAASSRPTTSLKDMPYRERGRSCFPPFRLLRFAFRLGSFFMGGVHS
jgi:hypothetical protein